MTDLQQPAAGLTLKERFEKGSPLELADKDRPPRVDRSIAHKLDSVSIEAGEQRATAGVRGSRYLVFDAVLAAQADRIVYRTASGATWKQDPRDADIRVDGSDAILHIPDDKPIMEA